ncbi:hypothetical protein [uncultured Aquimarina sp.]|uniref:hypothetical protein n=1 Tax=uncultured Aquimarina sp. TaxID=575652 RepID=UPI002618A55D|nr:hypothetical protein [uncultured Aquimarina sp.]
MKNKKLSLQKIVITRLNNLHHIKGGSFPIMYPETLNCTGISTKTNTELLDSEDNCNG